MGYLARGGVVPEVRVPGRAVAEEVAVVGEQLRPRLHLGDGHQAADGPEHGVQVPGTLS